MVRTQLLVEEALRLVITSREGLLEKEVMEEWKSLDIELTQVGDGTMLALRKQDRVSM
jgi:hypothetical protein